MRVANPKLHAAPADDASLVARACAGDDAAFTELFRRHAAYIARLAHRLLGTQADVDDVVQDTFVRALGSVAQIREPERVRSWLATVAVREVQRRSRRRARWRWLAREVAHHAPRESDPQQREQVAALHRALGQIPPKLRVPWVLHRIEGHAHAEVAELCETSVATVKRRIAEADQRLERRLREPG